MERRRQITEGIEADESDLDEYGDRIPLKRNSYTQEHKLAAIDYALHTWRINAKREEERIPYQRAAKKLGITDPMLKDWIKHRNRILLQKRGSHRSRSNGVGVEEGMEHQLNDEFEKV